MAAVRFGTIRAYDAGSGTATVGIVGYRGTAIQGIRVAANIDVGLVVDGARCVVVFNDVYSVADAVVVAVWG